MYAVVVAIAQQPGAENPNFSILTCVARATATAAAAVLVLYYSARQSQLRSAAH